MFEEPTNDPTNDPADKLHNAAERAKEKTDEFRLYAEIAAVYEGTRKYDAQIIPALDADVARGIQRSMAKLDKSKTAGIPLLPEESADEARELLKLNDADELSTNDYHVHRRPGEVMIVRWLAGDQVDTFYERFQAHFDAGSNAFREEERSTHGWKQDAKTNAYLDALDAVDVKMTDVYLRDVIREHRVFILSTQTADEMNIAYIAESVMGTSIAELVGAKSAPPDERTDSDLAWFYKMFSLRGIVDSVERMCFFTFLQKSDDAF